LSASHNLKKRNDRKEDLAIMARVMAKHFWSTDTETKIGEMAEKVHNELKRYARAPDLPRNPDTIRTWIKAVAPEFASRRGYSTD
jgi:thiamine kinase-like enzyme